MAVAPQQQQLSPPTVFRPDRVFGFEVSDSAAAQKAPKYALGRIGCVNSILFFFDPCLAFMGFQDHKIQVSQLSRA